MLLKKKSNKQAWIYLQSIFRIQPLPASPPWCKPSQSFSWNTAVRSWHFYFQSSNLGDSFNYKPVCIILLLKTIHEMGLHFPQKKQHKSHPNPKMCKPVAHAYPHLISELSCTGWWSCAGLRVTLTRHTHTFRSLILAFPLPGTSFFLLSHRLASLPQVQTPLFLDTNCYKLYYLLDCSIPLAQFDLPFVYSI